MADAVLGIIAAVVGVAAIGGIAAYINSRDNNNNNANDDDYGYTPDYEEPGDDDGNNRRRVNWRDIPDEEEWNEAFDNIERDYENDVDSVQEDFDCQNNFNGTKYIYIDFTKNLKNVHKRRNDPNTYTEPLEKQFEKLKRKLKLQNPKIFSSEIAKF